MLQNLINSLNREQLLACLNDPSVTDTALKAAVLHCATSAHGSNGAAEAPTTAPTATAPAKPAKPATAATAATAAATPAKVSPGDTTVTALVGAGVGFAVADVIAAGAGLSPPVTRSQASSAIKRAVKAGTCFGAGTRRFTRYAATQAVATVMSNEARG